MTVGGGRGPGGHWDLWSGESSVPAEGLVAWPQTLPRGPLVSSVGPVTCGPSDALTGTVFPGSRSLRENLLLILRNKEPGSNDPWDS